jgi:hypothetical protein
VAGKIGDRTIAKYQDVIELVSDGGRRKCRTGVRAVSRMSRCCVDG